MRNVMADPGETWSRLMPRYRRNSKRVGLALGNWYIFDYGNDASPDLRIWGRITHADSPVLSVQAANPNNILSWPASFTGFVLQQNDDLHSTNWMLFGGVIATNGNAMNATIAP